LEDSTITKSSTRPLTVAFTIEQQQGMMVKTGGPAGQACAWLLLAEGHLTRRVFGAIRRRIWALPLPAG